MRIRTHDFNLGKVAALPLSYTRVSIQTASNGFKLAFSHRRRRDTTQRKTECRICFSPNRNFPRITGPRPCASARLGPSKGAEATKPRKTRKRIAMETPLDGTGQKNRSRNNAARLRMPKILESRAMGIR